jgi:hypothetical protein
LTFVFSCSSLTNELAGSVTEKKEKYLTLAERRVEEKKAKQGEKWKAMGNKAFQADHEKSLVLCCLVLQRVV